MKSSYACHTGKADGSLRQVIHHMADSHMNSVIRFKLALTEDTPEIRPYYEERWAELSDSRALDIEVSLQPLDAPHHRWTASAAHLIGW